MLRLVIRQGMVQIAIGFVLGAGLAALLARGLERVRRAARVDICQLAGFLSIPRRMSIERAALPQKHIVGSHGFSGCAGMDRYRIWLVHSLLVVLLSGFASVLITNADHFPFSRYSMFSDLYEPGPWSALRLAGVTRDGGEFPIQETKYLHPFKWTRFEGAVRHLLDQPESRPLVNRALRDKFLRYEARRMESAHDGPPLIGMRLYCVTWDHVDVDAPPSDERISRREVVAEFSLFRAASRDVALTGQALKPAPWLH